MLALFRLSAVSCADVQDHSLPGPAGDLKQQMMRGQSISAQPALRESLPACAQRFALHREVFSSVRWQSALEAAGADRPSAIQAVHAVQLEPWFPSRQDCAE